MAACFLPTDATAALFGLGVNSFFFGLGVASLLLTLSAFLGRPGVLFGLSVFALRTPGLGVFPPGLCVFPLGLGV